MITIKKILVKSSIKLLKDFISLNSFSIFYINCDKKILLNLFSGSKYSFDQKIQKHFNNEIDS